MSERAGLHQIQEEIRSRVEQTVSAYGNWPCGKGCDECCRRLASPPRISRQEWLLVERALDELPAGSAQAARRRIRESASVPRPVTCPLLDVSGGTCLVYEARPLACRAYGFYAEREQVLGCGRIESLALQSSEVIWGNHAALEQRMSSLGVAKELAVWLAEGEGLGSE